MSCKNPGSTSRREMAARSKEQKKKVIQITATTR